jgi:hypothetical protein
MLFVADRSDDHIDALLRSLPAAPERWVRLVQELPLLESALERVDVQHDDLPALRAALVAVGLAPDEDRMRLLEQLRDRRCETRTRRPEDQEREG